MRIVTSEVLVDPAFSVPTAPSAEYGLAWLRGCVVRFSEGPAHDRRRLITEQILAGLSITPVDGGDPVVALLTAMGIQPHFAHDVAVAATAYQPHSPQSSAADEAVERLAAVFGAHDEAVAAHICILVQAHAGVGALITAMREQHGRSPVPRTRRVSTGGEEVEVDLSEAHFGNGRHACPGESLGQRLAEAAIR